METYKISDCIDVDFIDRDYDYYLDDSFLNENKWLDDTQLTPQAFRFREDVVRDGDTVCAW